MTRITVTVTSPACPVRRLFLNLSPSGVHPFFLSPPPDSEVPLGCPWTFWLGHCLPVIQSTTVSILSRFEIQNDPSRGFEVDVSMISIVMEILDGELSKDKFNPITSNITGDEEGSRVCSGKVELFF